jgi:hypothetical protein
MATSSHGTGLPTEPIVPLRFIVVMLEHSVMP